jgi:hypothetical protein
MSSWGYPCRRGRTYHSVTDCRPQAQASVISVHALSRDTVQYTFRMEVFDGNGTVFHNDDPVNELWNH